MTAALVEARKGIHAINKMAVMCGVPKSTLHDRISGRVQHGKQPGPSPYLNPTEEQELAGHLISMAKIGFGKTRKEVKLIAENVAKEKRYYRLIGFPMDDGKAFFAGTKVCPLGVLIPLHMFEWILLTRNQSSTTNILIY